MRMTLCTSIAALALAGQLLAGGFYLTLGNPDASPEARKMNAVLTILPTGCHDPENAKITATAIGVVNGQQREIPLKLETLPSGLYALTQQWPKEGHWVIKLVGKNGEMYTNSLVAVKASGVDRLHDHASPHPFTQADVNAMLQ